MTTTRIEILDSNLNLLTILKTPYPLNKSGDILTYSKELSDFGTCSFRISSYDSMFTNLGDILVPHSNHVRIRRGNTIVWQGAIIENPKRTKDFVEVTAVQYIWYLGKTLIKRSSANPTNGQTDGIYRVFNSGTMAAAVTAVINETITKWGGTNHALASLSLGTIDNPNYPPNMTDGNSPPKALSGPWSFGNGIAAPLLQYDFHSVLDVLKSFGAYTFADFEIDNTLKFNFRSFLGNDSHYDVNFVWGQHGNIVDFNISRLGQRQVNDLWGIAADYSGQVLHSEQFDMPSIQTNGYLEQVIPFADVKDQATLNARVAAQLPFINTADSSANTFVLSEKAYPLGVYDVGDIVTCRVDHTALQFKEISRIVGISVSLHNTGRELTTIQTNKPRPGEYGAV